MKKRILTLAAVTITVLMLTAFMGGCFIDSSNNNDEPYTVNIVQNEISEPTSLTETIELLRQQVVDVYCLSSEGVFAGSGVIISSNSSQSWIITNHHVIDNCYEFQVDVLKIEEDDSEKLTTYTADLIGGSPSDDIAVLRINKGGLIPATWVTDSSKVKVGTEVIAIGNPLGIFGGTVTKGIISATARDIEVESIGIMTLMQTDAAINNGNSGGGLFSTSGQLIGVVNSGYTGYEGLNFAIPANDAKAVATSLIETYHTNGSNYGYVTGKTNLGISIGYATVYATSQRTSTKKVIYLTAVAAGSVAASAGVTVSGTNIPYYAVTSIGYKGTTYTPNDNEYYTSISSLLKKVTIGESVTIQLTPILRGSQSSYYLSSSSSTKTIIPDAQYIYNPPTK